MGEDNNASEAVTDAEHGEKTRPSSDRPLLVTPREAARLLAVSRTTLDRWLHDCRLRSLKAGHKRLIPRSELDRFVGRADFGF